MSQVAIIDEGGNASSLAPRVIQADATSLMAVISRAASDPATDVDKLERLMALYERINAQTAKVAYTEALAEMQPKLPAVVERGGIKDRGGKVQSTYAYWEDINEAIRPCMAEHGFAITFRISRTAGDVAVTGVLSHKAGHSEETTMSLPVDGSGNKNAVQAVASSTSYGKRYTAMALLNITTRGEDDDGQAAGRTGDGEQVRLITPEQVDQLRDLIQAEGRNEKRFLTFAKLDRLEDIRADAYDRAVSTIKNGGKQ